MLRCLGLFDFVPLGVCQGFRGRLSPFVLIWSVRSLRSLVRLHFSSFAFSSVSNNAGSFFLREVILGAGYVREGAGPSVRAHSIRGVSTSAVFNEELVCLHGAGGRILKIEFGFYFLFFT